MSELSTPRRRRPRSLCVATAALAFLLGLVVGVAIPLLALPPPASAAAPRPVGGVSFVTPPAASTPSVLEGGVFWSDDVEASLPEGYDETDAESWRRYARATPVARLETGDCGRMQNRLLVFADGGRACCRYRQNTDQIQGELFSFLLARELGLRNLPPAALASVRPRDAGWTRVRPQLSLAQWAEGRPVVLTRFLPSLGPAHIPQQLRGASRRLHPPDVGDGRNASLAELAQWSDLLLFDYLTANLDRVVNNLYNLQWNSAMMDAPAHNLARDASSGLLVFLDNESGLLHGYRLLHKYGHFHASLLSALCVFRRRTVENVRRLHAVGDVGVVLQRRFADAAAPGDGDALPPLPERSVKILNERLSEVAEHVARCERLYAQA